MKNEEHDIFLIPRNFLQKGTIMGGTIKIRNAIEGGILAIGIGFPVVQLPLAITMRIILLCITSLPAAMISLIGINGESLSAFIMNAIRFLFNRRIIYRSDVTPPMRKRHNGGRIRPKNKEPKPRRRKKRENQEDPDIEPDFDTGFKKKEFDTSTAQGIKMQAKEDIRYLKYEKKVEQKRHKWKQTQAVRLKKEEEQQKRIALKEAKQNQRSEIKSIKVNKSPVKGKRKRRKYMTLEDYLPIDKIINGVIYTTDQRYIKILEIDPINFLLRSAREQQGIIYSFISYLKISPVKLHIKMLSKRADINKHLQQSIRELKDETDIRCQTLQEDYIDFVQKLSSKEAVSRRFFLIFEYEPFNANRRTEEKEIHAALQTAVQTAKTFLYQCGNQIQDHDNETEFSTEALYTLLNRSISADVPLQKRIGDVLNSYMENNRQDEIDHIPVTQFIAPETVDFKHPNYVIINGVYHAYLLVPSDGYKNKVMAGWLSLLINAGEGIDVDFFLHRQPKDRIQQRLGQQIRINRSKLKDTSDTNADFDDLDSAIQAGYYLKQGLTNNEDFYYMNLLITITATDLEELQWRIQEMKKLLISQDMDIHSCYFLQERGFLSTLPLASIDKKLYGLSKRNVLTSGAASCYPFTSYSIADDNGILFGVNKHNNSLVIADIFDSKQYKNSNICILGCSGAGYVK